MRRQAQFTREIRRVHRSRLPLAFYAEQAFLSHRYLSLASVVSFSIFVSVDISVSFSLCTLSISQCDKDTIHTQQTKLSGRRDPLQGRAVCASRAIRAAFRFLPFITSIGFFLHKDLVCGLHSEQLRIPFAQFCKCQSALCTHLASSLL